MTTVCRMHGLTVASPFPLSHRAPPTAEADVEVIVEERELAVQDDSLLDGPVIAELETTRRQYSLIDQGDGRYLFRFQGFADIHLEMDGRRSCVRCQLVKGAPRAMLPVMLGGNVMAALLLLRGELVLHASAVEQDGQAVALVGRSGSGKSTLAAMACLAGDKLVSDDVLRVDTANNDVRCHRGGAALRLRATSKALVTHSIDLEERSADGRHLFPASPTSHLHPPLGALFLPRLQDADQPLRRTLMAPKEALFTVMGCPRLYSWQDASTGAAHFTKLAAMTERVPIYLLDVPWGIGLESSRLATLSEALFAECPG